MVLVLILFNLFIMMYIGVNFFVVILYEFNMFVMILREFILMSTSADVISIDLKNLYIVNNSLVFVFIDLYLMIFMFYW